MFIKLFSPSRLRVRLLLCLCLCAISPGLQAADTIVGPGGNLQAVLNAASNGDVITVQAGTYTVLTGEPYFHIDKSITLQANGVVTLQAPTGAYFGLAVRASYVTVQGVTINGGVMGVMIGNAGGVAGAAVSQVTLTALTVNPTGSGGHGIYLYNTSFSTIDSCTVSWAYANGIFLDQNSNNNLLMNNWVQNTATQHAMAVKNSNFNTLANNTVTGSAFHGIELIGAAYNRVEKNTVSGFQWDGIVVTPGDAPVAGESTVRLSLCNYLGKNLVVSTGWSAGRVSGTGIWLNDVSDGSYVFGNDVSGSVEAGITAFNSSKSYIQANRVHGNGQAGLLWWNADYPTYPRPSYTAIHNNYIYDNPNNANILIRGAWYNDIAYNFISGTGLPASKNDGGVTILSWQQSGGSTGNQIYSNTFKDIQVPNYIGPDTTAAQFFQNRYINTGFNYSLQPADVKWDAGRLIGGNYWSGFPAIGNPSTTTPYYNFIINAAGTRSSINGPYVDKYPFQRETLGKQGVITIQAPVAGQIAAAGSQKTIAWKSKGGALVDIYYHSSGTGLQLITANYPDYGFYHWTLPSTLPPGTGYTIRMDCKNSSGQIIGSSATSGAFTIGSSELLLLSPGPDLMANGGSIIRVGWKKSASVAEINVFIAQDGRPWALLAANVSDNSIDITLPFINSNKVQILVSPSAGGNPMDATDGYFTVRGGTSRFTAPVISTGSLLIGDVVDLEWISPPNSFYVDLDLWDNNTRQFRPIVSNLPDRGKYTWFVSEYWKSGAYVQAIFRDFSGTSINTAKLTSTRKNITPILELLLLDN